MRWLWGALSLISFVIAVAMIGFIVSNTNYSAQVIGGVIAIGALLMAYFANRIGRRYRTA